MIYKKQYGDIIANLKNYNYTSIDHPEYAEYMKYEINKMDLNTILILDNSKNPIHVYWATNSLTHFIEDLKKINKSIFINFVPKEFVNPLENIGFTVLCEYVDFFNVDINGTGITFNNFNNIEFLLPSEVEQASIVSLLCQGQSRGFTGETVEWFEKWIRENKVIVVKKDNDIIGFCCVSIYANGTVLWIREIAVSPLHQRQGYGKLLMEQALCYGIENGAKRGFLATDILNEHAIELYKKYKFIPRNDESEIQMVKYSFCSIQSK